MWEGAEKVKKEGNDYKVAVSEGDFRCVFCSAEKPAAALPEKMPGEDRIRIIRTVSLIVLCAFGFALVVLLVLYMVLKYKDR